MPIQVEKQAFFAACDRHGIMLLSEMAHMGPVVMERRSGVSAERAAQVLEGEAIDTTAAVYQMVNHPSVVEYGYANEEYVNSSWCNSVDQYERIVRSIDDSRPVHAANPIPYAQRHGPYNFFTHRDQNGQRCVTYNTYNYGAGAEGTSADQQCGFVEGTGQIATGPAWPYEWDEVGACGMASMEQIRSIIPKEDLWPIDGDAGSPRAPPWHWHAAFGVQRNDSWLSPTSYRWLFRRARGPNGTLPLPMESLHDELEASQFLQAEGYRYIYQSNRRARWHRSAVAIWTFNEPFPNAAHGCLVDWSGRPKMALYYAQRAMAPLDVSLRYDNIWAAAGAPINATVFIDDEGAQRSTSDPVAVVAEAWSARSGKLLHSQRWSLTTLPLQVVTEVGALRFAPGLDCVGDTVVILLEARSSSLVLSSHVYTFGIGARDATADELSAPLAQLRAANRTTVVVDHESGSDRVVVRNTGANLALMVRLVPHNATSLDALAWVAFTDNHFYLRPSESRAVSVRKLGQGEQVTSVTAEGWNLE